MKDGIKHNAPVEALELGQEDLQAISGGISDKNRDMFEQMRKELLQKASRAAAEGRSEAADAYSDALECLARQEGGQSE